MSVVANKLGLDFDFYISERTNQFSGRVWTFERIHDWLIHPNVGRFLLLTGEPGSGKTGIAARLAEFSRGVTLAPDSCPGFSNGFLSAVHFCVARAGSWIDPVSFSRSISLQLAGIHQQFALALKNVGNRSINIQVTQQVSQAVTIKGVVIENLTLNDLNPQSAFTAAVVSPLEQMYEQGCDVPIIIFVDALDEALAYSGETTIVELLSAVDDLPPQVRFLLTSRPDNRIRIALPDRLEVALSSEDAKELSQSDIANYVQWRMNNEPSFTSKPAFSNETTAHKISAKADQNFLYAKLLLDDLASGRQSPQDLDYLPKDLDGFYSTSLQRAVQTGGGQWLSDYAPPLGILLVSRQPIDRYLIQQLADKPSSTISAFLNRFQQFLHGAQSSEATATSRTDMLKTYAYTLFHQSFRDFLAEDRLTSANSEISNPFFLDPIEWHEKIARHYQSDALSSHVHWDAVDDYGLRHLPVHLFEAHLFKELLGLVTSSFLAAKVQKFHSYRDLNSDLMLALDAAERTCDLPAALRVVLLVAGLRVRAGTVDEESALYALIGEVDRAVDLAEAIQAEWKRTVALRTIVAAIALSDPQGASLVAKRIDDLRGRGESLTLVFKARLRRDGWSSANRNYLSEVVAFVDTGSQWPYWQSHVFLELGYAMQPVDAPSALLVTSKALQRARSEQDPQHRYESLLHVAQFLVSLHAQEAAEVYLEALDALSEVNAGEWRSAQYAATLDGLAILDLSSAINRSRQIDDVLGRVFGLARSGVHLASRDMVGAEALFEEAESQIPNIGWRKAEWKQDAKKAIATARDQAKAAFAGEAIPALAGVRSSTLKLWELSQPQELPETEYRRRIRAAKEGKLKPLELRELVRSCFATGEKDTARELVREAVRKSSRGLSDALNAGARAVLIGAIADSNLPTALRLSRRYTGVEQSSIMVNIIATVARRDLEQAIALLKESPPKDEDYKARAIGAILTAAAQHGNVAAAHEYYRQLLRCGSPRALLDLKCDVMAAASGLVFRHDHKLSFRMLVWVLKELSGDPEAIRIALAAMDNTPLLALRMFEKVKRAYLNSRKSADDKSGRIKCSGLWHRFVRPECRS